MQNPELNTTQVGVIVLETPGRSYVCSAFNMTLALNAVPTASAVIGSGRPLKGDKRKENSAEDILEYLREAELSDSTSFIPCTVYEDLNGRHYTMFKGVIVAASLVYKAGASTVRAVRLELMNEACKLYARPLSDYQDTCGSNIIASILTGNAEAVTMDPQKGTTGFEYSGALDSRSLVTMLSTSIEDKDIATRISCLADAYVMLTSRTSPEVELNTSQLGTVLRIGDYIRSDYTLNKSVVDAVNTETSNNFNIELGSFLIEGLRSGSIMDTIIGAITSKEFMLTLVPRFTDFKLEIRPSKAWDNRNVKSLPLSVLSSMNSSYHPLEHLKDPDVFVVNYSDAIEFGGGSTPAGIPSGITGAYSTNPIMQRWLAERHSVASDSDLRNVLRQLESDSTHFKWKIYQAPQWLDSAFIQNESLEHNVRRNRIPNRNYLLGRSIADDVAKAIYTSVYRQSATTSVELLPHLRFGMGSGKYGVVLEDMIGEVIDLVPDGWQNDPDRLDDSPLAVRGMITNVSFSYSAGQAGSCQYSMTLSRVRPRNVNEPSVICPLYAPI